MALQYSTKLLAGKSDPDGGERWLPLWMHNRDTAEVMRLLVLHWLPEAVRRSIGLAEEILVKTAVFLGALHDVGKGILLFQFLVMQNMPIARERLQCIVDIPERLNLNGKTPHARASEAILLSLHCPRGLASIAGAHHGKPQEDRYQNYIADQMELFPKDYFTKGQKSVWKGFWLDLYGAALEWSGFSSEEELPVLSRAQQVLLTGLLTMADWLASNTDYFPLIPVDEVGEEKWYPQRVQLAWENISLTYPWESQDPPEDSAAFFARFGFSPNEMQQAVQKTVSTVSGPGLLIIEAQMGSGKTEAALAAAEIYAARFQEGGLFFGLPTQATANGIFDRLLAWAKTQSQDVVHSIRLAHGAAEFNENYLQLFPGRAVTQEDDIGEAGISVHPWFQGNKRALLADFVIGTVDQLLMAALQQRHVMLRHLGLAGKVVIVDECHAYDAYMNRYLDCILDWLGCYQVPVILLSATLPARRRRELVQAYLGNRGTEGKWQTENGYPLLTWTDRGQVCQCLIPSLHAEERDVGCSRVQEDKLPELIRKKLSDGGCAGVIVNTVKKAQVLAEILRGELPEFEVILLHAQFILPDRAAIEERLLRRLGKYSTSEQRDHLIVVGTQVIEQSLDIDLDFLVTELCPMDLLLQRIGRLHRHVRIRPSNLQQAECAVLDREDGSFDEGSLAVYGRWLLWRSRELLPDCLRLPTDIPRLVQETYDWENDRLPGDAESVQAKDEYEREEQIRNQRARAYVIPQPDAEDEENLPFCDTLDNWLQDESAQSDAAARAAVRDGDPSLDVLVMVHHNDGSIHFLPWQQGGRAVDADVPPCRADSLKIARQRLKLPGFFSRSWMVDQVIHELEAQNKGSLRAWQQSPVLQGELVLLLDEQLNAHLGSIVLHYDQAEGLTWRKEERNERNGV